MVKHGRQAYRKETVEECHTTGVPRPPPRPLSRGAWRAMRTSRRAGRSRPRPARAGCRACVPVAGFLVLQSGKRVTAIEISAPVGAGQQIPLSSMQQVQIAADSGLDYVPWDEAGQVSRFFTVSAIPAGTLLTRGMVAATGVSVTGKTVVGLALKEIGRAHV